MSWCATCCRVQSPNNAGLFETAFRINVFSCAAFFCHHHSRHSSFGGVICTCVHDHSIEGLCMSLLRNIMCLLVRTGAPVLVMVLTIRSFLRCLRKFLEAFDTTRCIGTRLPCDASGCHQKVVFRQVRDSTRHVPLVR